MRHNRPLYEPTKSATPNSKTDGNYKLRYLFKCAVESDCTYLIITTTMRNHDYDY